MLNNERIWKSFKNISLIGAFREKSQNVYTEQILSKVTSSYKKIYQNRFSYIPIFTREQTDSRCIINNKILDTTIKNKHFEDLLSSGEIENILSLSIANNKSKVMLAGNPQMITNTRGYLKKLGLQMSRRNNLAQIAVENYW
jgi:ferredoxin--NADP+ reductase